MDDNQLADAAYEAKVKDDWNQWWERNGAMVKRGTGEFLLAIFVLGAISYMVMYLR